jgi:probable HAF family extracellular repeat protein
MMKRSLPVLIIASAVLLLASAVHAGPPSQFVSIDYPGALLTNAQGISPGGDIVGTYIDSSGNQHGFLLSNGKFTSLDYPGGPGTSTFARGISPDGDIVGSYTTPPGTPPYLHGFLLSQGTYSEIIFPGHLGSVAQRILPDGDILGCYHDIDTMATMHGMVRSAAGFTGLDVQASMNNGATPVGNKIVGFYTDMMMGSPTMGRTRGYLIDYGTFAPFDVPGSSFTQAWDINPQGEIVGVFRDTIGKAHGFLRSADGAFTTIDFPGAAATRAIGINPGGDVVGFYIDSAGNTHAFLLSTAD